MVADRITIVHGDFRAGNFLFDDTGFITMLDWEMTHLGDPLEDLGWSSMRLWGHGNLAGGLIEREEYLKLYEQKSGAVVDRKRLFFYQVLGNAKMAVICLTGIRDFAEGRTADPTMVILLNMVLPILLEDLAAATEAGLRTNYAATHPKEIIAGIQRTISETLMPELKSPFAHSQAGTAIDGAGRRQRMDRNDSPGTTPPKSRTSNGPSMRSGRMASRRSSKPRDFARLSKAACAHPMRNRPTITGWKARWALAGGVATGRIAGPVAAEVRGYIKRHLERIRALFGNNSPFG